jgi:hypothetical protein
MTSGYGIFVQYKTGGTTCVAVTDTRGKAEAVLHLLNLYRGARVRFGVTPEMAKDRQDRAILELFVEHARGRGDDDVFRVGAGEVLLFIDALDAANSAAGE